MALDCRTLNMTTLEKRELLGIIIVTIALGAINGMLPKRLEIGYLLVALALLFLIQSLIRDLVILATQRKDSGNSVQGRFMCVESIVGFVPLVISILIISIGQRQEIALHQLFWPTAGLLIMLTCFLIKDWVVDLKNLRIRKEKNHINIVFKWNPR